MEPAVTIPAVPVAGARAVGATGLLLVSLFATTLFLGSFLMFMVEPMIAKMLLPVLGGAPMVWNTCVVFFQALLLCGYAYAHGATAWLRPKRHALIYALLVTLPLAALPFRIHTEWGPSPQSHPIAWLFFVLITSIGPAFFVLSTAASVIQKWFSLTNLNGARDPYFLYAASNLGSLIALAAYPTLVEPALTLDEQALLWAAGYGVFLIFTLTCVATLRHEQKDETAVVASATVAGVAPTWARRMRWVALAAVPSSLMLGVTNYLSTDIAAVPLLWVVPLWFYLATFVVAFGTRRYQVRVAASRVLPFIMLPLALMMVAQVKGPLLFVIPMHVAAFVAAALLCHSELAADRPSPRYLTEFYFWLALGGMVGGLFNTLLAPVLFSRIVEYPLALALACWIRPDGAVALKRPGPIAKIVPVCAVAFALLLIAGAGRIALDPRLVLVASAVLAVGAFSQAPRSLPFAVSVGAMLLVGPWAGDAGEPVLHAERTFFGVYRVSVDRTRSYHALAHGTTLHGMQALDPARAHEPLTYFHRTGPFGQAFASLPQLASTPQVAVVGLGVGTLASYATLNQHWTLYEIDPAVERMARNTAFFTYMDQCGARCRVVLGDARLSLAQAPEHAYGLIVLDAFSSDAIPMHLVTSEALSLYLARLSPGGVIAFHISNRHILLSPVLGRLAQNHGLTAIEQRDLFSDDWPKDKTESHWVLMARNRADLEPLVGSQRWAPVGATASTPLWRDDFSNVVGVLSFR